MPLSTEHSKRTRIRSLSCQRCRARKSKCDTKLPCEACRKEGVECIRIVNDRRKERYSSEYTESLQRKIHSLEGVIENIRDLINVKHDHTLDTDSKEHDLKFNIKSLGGDKKEEPLQVLDNQTLSVYGPTSVFDSHSVDESSDANHLAEIKALQSDPHILHCIKLFFKWQYPDLNSFVVREAFLLEFFTPMTKPVYCSAGLVLAICALGSRMSDDIDIFNKSSRYYREAKKIVMSRFDKPTIPTMQAYLLLSVFDISHGNNSTGWMLSGCGLRMGFDLGFQLDPTVWFLKSNGALNDLNIAIRSRIYWGCYFADHFISLVLGRPSVLKIADSSIPETGYLPDLDWIADYTYLSPGADPKDRSTIIDVSDPLKHLVRLINISTDMLNDVFTRDGSRTFDWKKKVEMSQHYNNSILQWRSSLPENLQWDRQSLQISGENPTKMFLRQYYYILLLCLNRPFLEAANQSKLDLPSARICDEVIDDLMVSIERFRVVHGLRKSSIFIVYCCILSVSVLLISSLKSGMEGETGCKIQFYLSALYHCSEIWPLAEKSFKLIQSQLEKTFEVEVRISNGEVKIVLPSLPEMDTDHKILHFLNGEQNQETKDQGIENYELFGGPPLLLTSDLLTQEYENLFSTSVLGYSD